MSNYGLPSTARVNSNSGKYLQALCCFRLRIRSRFGSRFHFKSDRALSRSRFLTAGTPLKSSHSTRSVTSVLLTNSVRQGTPADDLRKPYVVLGPAGCLPEPSVGAGAVPRPERFLRFTLLCIDILRTQKALYST